VAWAFSLAAAGNFAALCMGIWWRRTSAAGAVLGMIAGFGVTLFYLIATEYMGMPKWFGINNISAATFGLPVAFIVTYVVSLMTPEPSQEVQDMVDAVRRPRGGVLVADKT
jgi:cation/acetate symporter